MTTDNAAWLAAPESELQAGILATLRGLGSAWTVHIPASAYSKLAHCPRCHQAFRVKTGIPKGIPDTFGAYPGLLVMPEAKTEKGKITPEQKILYDTLGPNPRLMADIVRPSGFNAWSERVAQAVIKGKR
jgi:hypothetical protein